MTARLGYTVLFVATLVAGVNGFAPERPAVTRIGTELYDNTQVAPDVMPAIKDISYGEESRKFRRTVYSHDDWRKHRSSDRFIYYLASLFASGVYKSLAREVSATVGIAAFVCLYNALVGGYTDLAGVQHEAVINNALLAGLPLAPFTLSSPSLGLLLGKYL